MKHGVRILAEAEADVDEIVAFIARDKLDPALAFVDAIEATYRLIAEDPRRARSFCTV